MRALLALAAVAGLLAACGPKTEVRPEDDAEFASYHHIGVPAFMDRTGRGQAVADAFNAVLDQGISEPVDSKALNALLTRYKPEDGGFGVEGLQIIHEKTGADALILGRMTGDWSAAVITMVEMDTGSPVLRAILRPPNKKKKFTSPNEVAGEFLRAYTKLR